jgi:hypothetical protein
MRSSIEVLPLCTGRRIGWATSREKRGESKKQTSNQQRAESKEEMDRER